MNLSSTMLASVALSALRHAAAFQPVSPVFARRAMSLRAETLESSALKAGDDDFADFSSKVRTLIVISYIGRAWLWCGRAEILHMCTRYAHFRILQ